MEKIKKEGNVDCSSGRTSGDQLNQLKSLKIAVGIIADSLRFLRFKLEKGMVTSPTEIEVDITKIIKTLDALVPVKKE